MSRQAPIRDLKQQYIEGLVIRDYRAREVSSSVFSDLSGLEAAYRVSETRNPLRIKRNGELITMSDRDYAWYHFAPHGQNFWLSAAYTPELKLLELYFDITAGNDFSDPDNPCFRDLYLDVVLTPEGEVFVLDRDELENAYNSGQIGEDEYDKAQNALDDLLRRIEEEGASWISYCSTVIRELLPEHPR